MVKERLGGPFRFEIQKVALIPRRRFVLTQSTFGSELEIVQWELKRLVIQNQCL